MKKIPMLFSGAMALANLAGIKGQTRRIIGGRGKGNTTLSQPTLVTEPGEKAIWSYMEWDSRGEPSHFIKKDFEVIRQHLVRVCPYGEPGDIIWQRETLRRDIDDSWLYAADDKPVIVSESEALAVQVWALHKQQRVCPSIHMPAFACRFYGERTGVVRVEQLQDITEEDAIAEGITKPTLDDASAWDEPTTLSPYYDKSGGRKVFWSARDCYADFWDHINADKPGYLWKDNPWVYVVTYKGTEASTCPNS